MMDEFSDHAPPGGIEPDTTRGERLPVEHPEEFWVLVKDGHMLLCQESNVLAYVDPKQARSLTPRYGPDVFAVRFTWDTLIGYCARSWPSEQMNAFVITPLGGIFDRVIPIPKPN